MKESILRGIFLSVYNLLQIQIKATGAGELKWVLLGDCWALAEAYAQLNVFLNDHDLMLHPISVFCGFTLSPPSKKVPGLNPSSAMVLP